MKRHVSIFTFLLGVFAAAAFAPSASAGRQNLTGGYYYFDGSYMNCDAKYMSATNGSLTVQNVEDGDAETFMAHPDPGMKVANWKALSGQTAQFGIMQIQDWPVEPTTTNYTLIADSSKGSWAYLAVNFTYIPIVVTTNGHVFVKDDIGIRKEMTLPVLSKEGNTGKWKNEKGDTFEFGAEVSGSNFWYGADGDPNRGFYANLTADWTANTYTIAFDGNGATGGSMEPMSCTYGKSETLTKNTFERSLHEFDYWTTNKVGSGQQFKDGESVRNLTAENDGTVTMYAQWKRTVFTMTFDPGGGTCDPSSKTCVVQKPIGELPTPEWEYHRFLGWFTAKEGGQQITEITATGEQVYVWDRDITLYAHWDDAKGYDITAECDPKRGTVKVEGTKVGGKFVEKTEVVFTATENDGYSFSHWVKGQSVYTDNPLTNIATESVTYIGVFTGNVYQVTFLSLEGLPLQQEKFVTFGSAYGTLPTVENVKDRVLDGWYTGLSGGGTKIEPTTEVDQPNNDRILFANWKDAPVYYIAFDGNGATNETKMADQKAYCGEDVALASNQYARTGYTFEYWTNSVGEVYLDGETVHDDLANTNETATLYATWSPISYTLAFDSQGGDFGQELVPMDCIYGREYELQYRNGTRELFAFAGWSNAWNGAVYSAANGFKVQDAYDVPNGTNTLIAIWNSQLTDYSRAMHCTNLVWESKEPSCWTPVFDPAAGFDPISGKPSGSCARSSWKLQADHLSASLSGPGTLGFWWKSSSTENWAIMDLLNEDNKPITNLVAKIANVWQYQEMYLDGVSKVTLSQSEGGYSFDIDQMTWTPKPLHPVPDPEKDFVTISSAAVSDGKFVLSFEFNEEFDYLLKTNANLLIDSWGVMGIEGTKTDNILTFEPQIIEGQPQMFYKVETIQKK